MPSLIRKIEAKAFDAAQRMSLWVSPWMMARVLRRQFATAGIARDRALGAHAPTDVARARDIRYGEDPDMLLDAYWPERVDRTGETLPMVMWLHGGGWVGGTKEELANYLRMIATHGFTVVAPRYSLAPEKHYPTPVRQTFTALRYVVAHADSLHVDSSRLLLAGDSAGAHIGAQAAILVTNPAYVELTRVEPSIAPRQLRGVALCCGPYDLVATGDIAPMRTFFTVILRAYSGARNFREDPNFATSSLVAHVTADFPPAFVTAGNEDVLTEHSTRLVDALRRRGVEVETLFYAPEHDPPLGHEYQFDFALADARVALDRMVAFFTEQAR